MLKQLKKEKIQHLSKVLVGMLLIEICLVSSVLALGVGPTRLDITVEKGKETELVQYIQVANPETNPVRISGSVTGSISEFVTIEPNEFDLPAGPGIMTSNARPYKYVKAIIRVPREVSDNEYSGEILFTEQPVTGGALLTSAQLGVRVNLKIGTIAQAIFPVYINAMVVLLAVLLVISVLSSVRKRGKKK